MPDREKVIKGLKEISDYFFDVYREETNRESYAKAKDRCDVIEFTLELLKEQEAVPPIQREVMNLLVWCCGSCGVVITHGDKFCRMCGRKVKWE